MIVILYTILNLLTRVAASAGLFVPALLSASSFDVAVSLSNKRHDALHLLTSVLFRWCLRQILQQIVESIDVLSFLSNLPDSTAAARSRTDIAVAIDALSFALNGITRHRGELGRDGCSILSTRRSGGFWIWLFFCVIRRPSLLMTVSGFCIASPLVSVNVGKQFSFLRKAHW